jgi:hypothetical protein
LYLGLKQVSGQSVAWVFVPCSFIGRFYCVHNGIQFHWIGLSALEDWLNDPE